MSLFNKSVILLAGHSIQKDEMEMSSAGSAEEEERNGKSFVEQKKKLSRNNGLTAAHPVV